MAFTRPKAAQIDFDVTNISDPLIRLNSSQTGSPTKDAGIVIERGDSTNAAMLYDESADQFVFVNTTEDGTTSGDVTISSYSGLQTGALNVSSLSIGGNAVTASGTELSILSGLTASTSELNVLDGITATTTELNYTDGVTSNIQTQLNAKLALAGGTMSGAIAMGTSKITGMGDPTAAQDAATKAYVDTQTSSIVTTTDIAGDSGTDTVTLGTDTITFSGTANEITTAVTNNTVTFSLPDDVTVGGNLTITGGLTVNGTTTTINSTTLTVDDLNIVLASGAADSAAADGAGITIDGANASLIYDHTGTQWEFNKPLEVAGAITGTTITGTSFVTSGDMSFGDSDKAKFGAGNDLQIYHDGSNSYVSDTGTGNLIITGSGQVRIEDGAGNLGATFNANSDVVLRHAGSIKLATTSTGIDVTGTVVSDGQLVIGSYQQKALEGNANGFNISIDSGTDVVSVYNYYNAALAFGVNNTNSMYLTSTGLGIGETSPSEKLSVVPDTDVSAEIGRAHIGYVGGNDYAGFSHVDQNAIGSYALLQNSVGTTYLNAATGQKVNFRINNADKMVLDASGNVGIGETSPTKTLTVGNTDASAWITSGGSNVHLTVSPNGASGAFIVRTGGTNGDPSTTTERMRIDSSGNATFAGNITATHASSPALTLTDTTSSTTLQLAMGDSFGIIGTTTAQPLYISSNNTVAITLDTSQNATFAGTVTINDYTLPSADSTSGYVLATNGSGTVSFTDPTTVSGLQGTTGTQGATGAQGTTGATGGTGSQGATGAQGTTGATGGTGSQGTTGTQGTTGATGGTGSQGTTGTQGTTGATGGTGSQGTTGTQGTTGATGGTGSQGTTGTQGTTGATGGTGSQGTTGTQGTTGSTGSTGSQGTTGAQGTTGSTGGTGSQGTTGADGNFGGATFDYAFSTTTTDSDPGAGTLRANNANLSSATLLYIDDVDQGSTNIEAFLRTIDDSTSTIKGHVRISNRLNADDFTIFAISGTNTEATGYHKVTVSYLSGATSFSNAEDIIVTFARTGTKGDTGSQGTTGNTGGTGSQGATGAQGTTGNTGGTGSQGTTGTQGTTGATGGTGSQGATGAQGITGNTGGTGSQGTTGTQGATGAQGTTGNTGGTGSQGATGAQGITGNTGGTGSQGTTGTQGTTGSTGGTGSQGTTGTQGTTGSTGGTGATGSQGTTGIQVQLQDGPPSSPANGQIWLETDTLNPYIYYNDGTSSQWLELGSTASSPWEKNGTSVYYSGGNIGIGKNNPSVALDVVGEITASSDITSNSDERLKENIETIPNGLEIVNNLRGVNFTWKEDGRKSVGVIAQEVEQFVPELVFTNKDGIKSVNYAQMVGILIEAIKEQQKQIQELRSKLDD